MPIDARIPLMVQQRDYLADAQSLAQLAQRKQATAMQQQQFDMNAQEQQQAKQREEATMIARLTNGVQDEGTYQQRLAAAKAYGIDVSGAPPNYDPDWVQTQNVIAETFLREPQKLTNTAQELVDAGYQPGTSQFIAAMRNRLTMQDSKVITTQAGGAAGLLGPNGYQQVITPNDGSQQAGAPVGGVQEGATATNPQTGEKLIFRGGQWQKAGGGASNGIGGF